MEVSSIGVAEHTQTAAQAKPATPQAVPEVKVESKPTESKLLKQEKRKQNHSHLHLLTLMSVK